ncbi:hypothetical protein CES85_3451 (plasmid) [Ochrobactrum quorumnocens]|uniref:Uncharacterized protein n=1 Tax=Ochrobactrum quorumnocens TaxID=271865 RepID=A0A248UQ89_9HYPH|nr:hypothetical protein CES85_3451 [[Ochrobactrum] quorumnocens]
MVSTTGTIGVAKPNSFELSDETVRLIEIAKTGHYTSVFSAPNLNLLRLGLSMRPCRSTPAFSDQSGN